MRLFGAVRGTGRFASEDIEYRGVLFPAGTMVSPALAVANRDGAVFADPGTFDITREPAGHRTSRSAAASTTASAPGSPRPSCRRRCRSWPGGCPTSPIDGDVTWKPSNVGIFGPEHLPVTFTPPS